ncbi:MAG: tRNA lysidine(34) synthetase TilS, partial [Chloroflexi bacterium]|nr:tRNA lysidine(34) synthetase TilS [Chloroflexota bacterium]
ADAREPGQSATLPGGLRMRVERDVITVVEADAGLSAHLLGRDAPALASGYIGEPFSAGASVVFTAGAWLFEAWLLAPEDDLEVLHADPLAAALAVEPGAQLHLRTWQPGDRFQPRGMGGHSKKLGDLFNAMGVPVSWRDRVPLLVVGNDIAWFVALAAPVSAGAQTRVRGRVSTLFSPEHNAPFRLLLAVRWRRANHLTK